MFGECLGFFISARVGWKCFGCPESESVLRLKATLDLQWKLVPGVGLHHPDAFGRNDLSGCVHSNGEAGIDGGH